MLKDNASAHEEQKACKHQQAQIAAPKAGWGNGPSIILTPSLSHTTTVVPSEFQLNREAYEKTMAQENRHINLRVLPEEGRALPNCITYLKHLTFLPAESLDSCCVLCGRQSIDLFTL